MPRALIFGMVHHPVDHYQVCSNCGPGAFGPVLGVTYVLHIVSRGLNGNFVRESTLAVVVVFDLPVVIILY